MKLTAQELTDLIQRNGEQKTFLIACAYRDITSVKKIIETYGKAIVKTFGEVSIMVNHNDWYSLPLNPMAGENVTVDFLTQTTTVPVKGYGVDLAIMGNRFPLDKAKLVDPDLVELVKLLIVQGCPVQTTTVGEAHPLHRILDEALRLNSDSKLKIVESLLQAGANPYDFEEVGSDLLPLDKVNSKNFREKIITIYRKYYPYYNEGRVQELKLNQINKGKIFAAILNNEPERVKEILDRKGSLNLDESVIFRHTQYPLLALACILSRGEIALQLLRAGAKATISFSDEKGKKTSLLSLCIGKLNKEVFIELLSKGVNVNEVVEEDPNVSIPLRAWHLFCLAGAKDLIKLFSEKCSPLLLSLPSSKYTLHDFFHPEKNPEIKSIHEKLLKKLEEKNQTLEMIRLQFYRRFYETLQPAFEAQDNLRMEKALDTFILQLVEEEASIFLDILLSSKHGIRYPSAKCDFVKDFMEECRQRILPIWELHQTFKEFFQGGNANHQEICKIIDQISLGSSQQRPLTLFTSKAASDKPLRNISICTQKKTAVMSAGLSLWSKSDVIHLEKETSPKYSSSPCCNGIN
ncbi:MAG: hypothetical protein H2069_07155 [Legionella sp.]|nr:hypothetical protein [Legionella sp.]